MMNAQLAEAAALRRKRAAEREASRDRPAATSRLEQGSDAASSSSAAAAAAASSSSAAAASSSSSASSFASASSAAASSAAAAPALNLSTRDALIAAEEAVVQEATDCWQQLAPDAALGVMPLFMHLMTRSGRSGSAPDYTHIGDERVLSITSPLVLQLSNPVNKEFTRNDKGDALALTFERLHAACEAAEWPAGSLGSAESSSAAPLALQTLVTEMSPLITKPDECPPVTKPPFLPPCLTLISALLATAPRVIVAFGRSVQERWRRCWQYGGEIELDDMHNEEGIRWYTLRYVLDDEERTTFVVESVHPSASGSEVGLFITAALLLAKSLALTGQPPEKGVFTPAMKAAVENVRAQAIAAGRLGGAAGELLAVESWDAGFELLKRMFDVYKMKMGHSSQARMGPLPAAIKLGHPNPKRLAQWVQDVFKGVSPNQIALKQRITEWCRNHKPEPIDMYYVKGELVASRKTDEPEEMKLGDHYALVEGVKVQHGLAREQAYRCIVKGCTSPYASEPQRLSNVQRHLKDIHGFIDGPEEVTIYPHNAECPVKGCGMSYGSNESLAVARRNRNIHMGNSHPGVPLPDEKVKRSFNAECPVKGCGKSYSSKDSLATARGGLRKHILKEHPSVELPVEKV